MGGFTREDMEEAILTIDFILRRSERAQGKFARGAPQYTLLANRIKALGIASALMSDELAAGPQAERFTHEELEKAAAPIASLISKSYKARQKLMEDSWQYAMLESNLKALRIAELVLTAALRQQ